MIRSRLSPSLLLALLIASGSPCSTSAQTTAAPAKATAPALTGSITTHPDWPKANPADVQSPDSIVAALYDVISGGVDQARDWNRFRSLFVPDARLIPTRHSAAEVSVSGADVQIYSPDQYIERSSPALAKGFFEHGIHNTTESFGGLTHVFSTYESRHTKDGAPFARGINSIQLLNDGHRYWVVTIFWDQESPTNPLPAKYLP